MTRILTLAVAAAALSLSSCASMKKDECATCCASKEKACCTAAHAKGAKCDTCEKGKTHKH